MLKYLNAECVTSYFNIPCSTLEIQTTFYSLCSPCRRGEYQEGDLLLFAGRAFVTRLPPER